MGLDKASQYFGELDKNGRQYPGDATPRGGRRPHPAGVLHRCQRPRRRRQGVWVNGGSIVELHRGWAILEVPGRESRVSYNRLRSDTPNGRLP
jgi:hypothetical protein